MEKQVWKRKLTEFSRSLSLMVRTSCFTESEQRMVKKVQKNIILIHSGPNPPRKDIWLVPCLSVSPPLTCPVTAFPSCPNIKPHFLMSCLWWVRRKMSISIYLEKFHVLQDISGCSFIVYNSQIFQHFLMGCVFCICYSCAV